MVARTRVFSESSMILPTTVKDTMSPIVSGQQLKRRVSAGNGSSSTNLYHPEPEYHHTINVTGPRPSPQRTSCRQTNKKPTGYSTWFLLVVVCTMTGVLIYGKQKFDGTHQNLSQVLMERDVLTKNQGQLLLQLEQTRRKLGNSPKSDQDWSTKLDTMRHEARALEKELKTEKQAKRDSEYEKHQLQSKLQDIARRSIVDKFGNGPYYVQFVLKLPNQNKREYFTVEMASTDAMPAAVYTFLNQVSKLLWDYTSFYLNADHVLMARPVSTNGKHSKRAQFDSEGLTHVPFQEYHEEYPHVEYTMGFSGKPAGPDLYINKEDNTVPHGPEGHQHFGAAEPCFGRVIIGKEVIDKVSALPGLEEKPSLLAKSVEILSARVLNDLKEAIGGPQYLSQEESPSR